MRIHSVNTIKTVDKNINNKWAKQWLIVFRGISKVTNERTAIFSILPKVAVAHSAAIILPKINNIKLIVCLLANLNSLTFDFIVRQKVGGNNMSFFILKQLPILPPESYTEEDIEFISTRVLELVYTAWDMQPFALDMGYDGEPFIWNSEIRALLRAELDAYYAKLYGLTRDELRYILDPADVYGEDFPSETFRVLKNNEIKPGHVGFFFFLNFFIFFFLYLSHALKNTNLRTGIAYPAGSIQRTMSNIYTSALINLAASFMTIKYTYLYLSITSLKLISFPL